MQDKAQGAADLARADAITGAIAQSATALARSLEPEQTIPHILALIGAACGVSRVQIYENEWVRENSLRAVQRYEWVAPGVKPAAQMRMPHGAGEAAKALTPLLPRLAEKQARSAVARTVEEPLRAFLMGMGVKSALAFPIYIGGKMWGAAAFEDCRDERDWSALETDALKVLAALTGAAIARARDVVALADAGRIVEGSSTILYRIAAQAPHAMIYISRNVSRYGYAPERMVGSSDYINLFHPDDIAPIASDIARVAGGKVAEAVRDARIRSADGTYIWFECRTSPVRDRDGSIAAIEGLAIDIDRRKTAEVQLQYLARTDQLTGLASRVAFLEQIRTAFATAKRGAGSFAVLYIDIDHFKDVNDVLGHGKGDELLKLVAQRLDRVRRTNDLIARFGGDEFAILQVDVDDPSDAGTFAMRILHELSDPPYNIDPPVEITASIGIAVYTPDIRRPEDMLKQADLALYRAKDSGRNQFHFHSEALDVAIIERVTLAGDLRHAVERGEIELYYQPQVELPSGRIFGLEALARWHHPKRGLLHPSQFIPIAERDATIVAFGRWVLQAVCTQIGAWRAADLHPPPVAVNVSAMQIKAAPDFDGDLMLYVQKCGLTPDAIELELTESVLMETTRENSALVDRLRDRGFAIAIDDFGTGYSSLGYLRTYHVSHIKIAQEFVRGIQEDTGDMTIVRATLSLARELGIKVIAEGVETERQLELLTAAGCRYIQGHYFSPPVPAAQAGALLRQGVLRGGGKDLPHAAG
ncbi:MAG: putative bifunctional diguanylate cyclase/phosphodiesterase [Pseudolabrys sp.]